MVVIECILSAVKQTRSYGTVRVQRDVREGDVRKGKEGW